MSEVPELKSCPFCGAQPFPTELLEMFGIDHRRDCFFGVHQVFITPTVIPCWNVRADIAESKEEALCPVHRRLEDLGKLEVPISSLGCVACSLNERQELLEILGPCAPLDVSQDSVTVLREVVDFYQTHHGEGRVVVSYPAPATTPEESK